LEIGKSIFHLGNYKEMDDSFPDVTPIVSTVSSILFVVAVLGALWLGFWIHSKYFKPAPAVPPPVPSKPAPEPEPHGWGPGPWGPDPWASRSYGPMPVPEKSSPMPTSDKLKVDAPKADTSDKFNPVLTLMSAKYDSASKYIQADYKILPNGSVPPSKSYSIQFRVLVDGKSLTDDVGDEPLDSHEMTGLQQRALVPVSGVSADVKPSQMTLSAQIHFRENGTANMGVIGIPVTTNVS
jgi:hypothetical protein